MSRIGGDASRLVLASIGMAYFAGLAVALILLSLPPLIPFALTVGGVGVLLIALRPLVGVHAFLGLLFFENAIPTAGGLTGMKLLSLVILAGWLLNLTVRRQANVRFHGLLIAMVLFDAWAGVSLIYAYDSDEAISRVFTFLQLTIAALMFNSVVDDLRKMRGVYWGIVGWTFLSTFIAIVEYYVGFTSSAIGFVGNRNFLATYISLAIVPAFLLHQESRDNRARFLLLASLPVFFLGMALTFSRTGMIVFVLTLLLVWYRVIRRKGFLVLAASLATLCVVAIILPEAFWKRVETIVPSVQYRGGTFGKRIDLWQAGMEMIKERPLVGVGPGNFPVAYVRYARGEMLLTGLVAHNTYVGVAAEMGLVGLVLFMLICFVALVYCRRAIVSGDPGRPGSLHFVAIATEINLIAILIWFLTGDSEMMKIFWVTLGLSASLGALARDRKQASSGTPPLRSARVA